MRPIFDANFSRNKARYVAQCLLAALSVFAVLILLEAHENTAVIAALGASSFIAFTMPRTESSKPRLMIGGYVVGIVSGLACHSLSLLPFLSELNAMPQFSSAVYGALAVGLSIFLMVVTDTEHPPASGVALGLVLNNCDPRTILVVGVGIVVLSVIKRLLQPVLINLL